MRNTGVATSLLGVLLALFSTASCQSAEIPAETMAKFADAHSRLDRMQKLAADNPQVRKDAYVQLGIAVADRFQKPIPGGPDGTEAEWAKLQAREVNQVLDWTQRRIDKLVKGEARPYLMPRPVGRPEIREGLLYARSRAGEFGEVKTAPYWYSGYMNYAASAWNTTTDMLSDWPNFGVTLLQNAPSMAFVGPGWKPIPNKYTGKYDLTELPEVLKKAAENGVLLDLGISPHILPEWTYDNDPEVFKSTPAGFIGYNIDHPKAKEALEKWIRLYVPMVKDSPGLLSFYMSNEPEYLHSGRDQWSRPPWVEWLRNAHKSVHTLNKLYGTSHASFEDVPVPGTQMPEGIEAKRAFYDWVSFNHQHFADWHGWINRTIKSVAPEALTHVKALRVLDVTGHLSFVPVPDPEPLSDYTDLADSDAWPCVPAHEGPDDYWWRSQSLNYDLLHSFRGQPVFDSENHVVAVPYGPQSLSPEQTRAAVWQGALHHRSAVALFVWESWTSGDSLGQIYFRPANIYGADQAMLDMNRLGSELATINKQKAKVALLYSRPSVFWESAEYPASLRSVYTALTFMGQAVTFISERQLASGKFSSANSNLKWIIVPRATHVTSAALAGLEKFTKRGGKVLLVGEECLGWDEYHQPRTLSASLQNARQIEATADERAMMAILKPALAAGGLVSTSLTEAATGSDVWQVEYRVVQDNAAKLVPMISYATGLRTLKLGLSGKAVDLLTGVKTNPEKITLAPMVPVLLQVR